MGKETIKAEDQHFFLIKILQFQNGYVLLDVMNKQLQKQQKEKKYECN